MTRPARFATTTATTGHRVLVEELNADTPAIAKHGWRVPSLDALVVATMLPFASAYEPRGVRLLREGATLGAYVVVLGQPDDAAGFYSPDVVAISPIRTTVRLSARPRLLGKRAPFIGPSDLIASD
jgi:hypothetical protein